MNVALIQAIGGSTQFASSAKASVGTAPEGNNMFGTVFTSVLAGEPATVALIEESGMELTSNEMIASILNAATVEEIADILGVHRGTENELPNSVELENLAHLLDLDVNEILRNIAQLLEQAGVSENELAAVMYGNDFWSVLGAIDEVSPKFFAEMENALEGKGSISKEHAIELVALLKSAAIIAPKTDLMMKQEQQVFSLQGFLAVTTERIESLLSTHKNWNGIPRLMETHHIIQVASQAQNAGNEDNPKETAQTAVNQLFATRSEVPLSELEARNNSRNEALLKEMQNIFKRSNFGQTGGTNRLLIKLYPEHLGQVRIELLQVNGVMTARILASTALGKEMLNSQLHQLKSAFVQQNLQVDRIDVSQTLQDTSRNERDNAFNQHFKQEQEETPEHEDQASEEEMTFQEYMIELEA